MIPVIDGIVFVCFVIPNEERCGSEILGVSRLVERNVIVGCGSRGTWDKGPLHITPRGGLYRRSRFEFPRVFVGQRSITVVIP